MSDNAPNAAAATDGMAAAEPLDPQTRAALADLMASRANVYRLLSRCFRSEVDAALARELPGDFAFASDDAALTAHLDARSSAGAEGDDAALERLTDAFVREDAGLLEDMLD